MYLARTESPPEQGFDPRMPTPPSSSGATQRELTTTDGPYSAEFSVLLACCRVELRTNDEDAGDILARSLANISNWERVFELAGHHGVLPAMHHVLCGSGAGSTRAAELVPREVRDEIERRFAYLTRKNLRLAAELIHVLDCLDSTGVAAIPHKGPVLAESLYGDVALRDFSDLDVLVQAADVPRVKAALALIGYTPNIRLSAAEERAYLASGYEYTFDSPAGKNLLEIQWNFVPRFYAVDFAMEGVFARAQRGMVAGRAVGVLAAEDLFLSMCVHAAKHLWGRLCWVRDIAAVAQRVRLDWERLHREATGLGVERIVSVSLLLARSLLGARPLEGQLAQEPSYGGRVTDSRITGMIAQHIANAEDYNTESVDYVRWMVRLRERFRDQWRFASRLLITPGLGEWGWVKLPEPLFPLYRGVRLVRAGGRVFRLR